MAPAVARTIAEWRVGRRSGESGRIRGFKRLAESARSFLCLRLIAIPILIQVYFNSSLTYDLMKLFRVPYPVAAPGALIGTSNFFELAVATAIALYGPGSGAALATVVGVLVEVPVMLSVCHICVSSRHWFEAGVAASEA